MTIFSSILHWNQIRHQHTVDFAIINWNSGDIILKFHCFPCRNAKGTIINSFKVYGCLINSKYCNLPEIKVLTPKWFFSVRSSEFRVYIHCNSNLTNWSLVENVFLDELFFYSGNDKNLCYSFQADELHRSIGKHVHSFCVIVILESNTTSVVRTINNSNCNVEIVAICVKM